jgi:hypothetical protein
MSDGAGSWKKAQNAKGKDYFYHTVTKETSWTLSQDDSQKLTAALKEAFVPRSGWMSKRAPRTTDGGGSSFKRSFANMFTGAKYQRRYFVLNVTKKMLYYFEDEEKEVLKGSINLADIRSVSCKQAETIIQQILPLTSAFM